MSKHGIPKRYESGGKTYKIVTEEHFHPPLPKPTRTVKSKPFVQPVRIVNPSKVKSK